MSTLKDMNFYTVKECMDILGITSSEVNFKRNYLYGKNRQIACYRIGRDLFIQKDDLHNFIESRRQKTHSEYRRQASVRLRNQ